MKRILAACIVAAGVVAVADDVAWPSDFWTNVTNHEQAVQARVSSVPEQTLASAMGPVIATVPGTLAVAYDSILIRVLASNGIAFDSVSEAGIALSFR